MSVLQFTKSIYLYHVFFLPSLTIKKRKVSDSCCEMETFQLSRGAEKLFHRVGLLNHNLICCDHFMSDLNIKGVSYFEQHYIDWKSIRLLSLKNAVGWFSLSICQKSISILLP